MTWRAHKTITFSAVYLITHSFPAALIAALSSVFPDFIEFVWWCGRVPRYAHRKGSHWFVPYLAAALLAFYGLKTAPAFPAWVAFGVLWFAVGCLAHIVEDALTGRVPLLSPRRRSFGLRFFRTGSTPETILTAVLGGLAIVTLFREHYRFVAAHLEVFFREAGLF
ncbi:metal-dependent hydrolase [Thermosulfurimonas marina]|uniref:Metal-dependent hydrolase n=1 Tax=Thermosulfurimonas marina TaxID=2047767 RepID=A0A6H1WUG0_9BACT|nr:metal-dependent hydrolase [Thermosulfurimonas marina]QJA06837.1 metal-dependent hydrolase [Thermosulfurimonas marina]